MATVFSQGVAGIGITVYTFKKKPDLLKTKTKFQWNRMVVIIKNDVFTGIQQSVMNLGILMIQGLVNSFGTTVMAAADGVVMTTADLTSSYGTHIVIQHANGTQTWYGHGTRGSICVKPGQIVKKGEKIMLSGSTGHSSGPHLHFEVRVSPYKYKTDATAYGQDSRVDPNKYM